MALSKSGDTVVYLNGLNPETAKGVVAFSPDGTPAGDKKQYTLLTNHAAIGAGPQVGPISGGDYIWRVEASNWNSGTATLQFLGLDGATWYPVRNAANTADVTLSANGSVSVGVAQGAILRVNVTAGAPTAMNSVLGGL